MISKTPSAPRLVIVGGVAGGMSFATRARRLCESSIITVFEKGKYCSYANCGIPYALGKVIEDDAKLVPQTPESFKRRHNIDVHLESEVIALDRANKQVTVRAHGTDEKYPYDHLILAQGAEAVKLPILGATLPQVCQMITIDDMQHVRRRIAEANYKIAVVVGGGFIGLEVAENLVRLGLHVILIEAMAHVFPPVDGEIAEIVHTELRKHGVELHLQSQVTGIGDLSQDGPVLLETNDGHEIRADLVIMAVGTRARLDLARSAGLDVGKRGIIVDDHMRTSDPDIYAVGDMIETQHLISKTNTWIPLAGPANRQGRIAADNVCGRDVTFRGSVGTSVCQVFDLTVGCTGVSTDALRAAGRDVQWITVHSPDHATYYPGSARMTLRVAFDANAGALLGAQAVGKKGVDKRIDVLATAIQAGMAVEDLEHLELAYAPPYSSAKDPVNMAGFVGGNVYRGEVQIIHASEIDSVPSHWDLLDVRSPTEFASGHLEGAINICLDDLRTSTHMLDNAREILVYCQVGYRGYLACKQLAQRGFQVWNLDGGLQAVTQGYPNHAVFNGGAEYACLYADKL